MIYSEMQVCEEGCEEVRREVARKSGRTWRTNRREQIGER